MADLSTQTVLDIVEDNFEAAGLKTFACRVIYAGKFALDDTSIQNSPDKEVVKQYFLQSVQHVNDGYCDIELTGLLLMYDRHYVHILEGSEDTVNRQMRCLLSKRDCCEEAILFNLNNDNPDSEEGSQKSNVQFSGGKVLVVYHSVGKLIFKGWNCMMAKPATLTVKLATSEMSDHLDHLQVCVQRINKLCDMFAENNQLTFEGLSAADPRMDALPECELLDFLLSSPHVLDLKEYMSLYHDIEDFFHSYEKVWPLPTHYTPSHMYKLQENLSFVPPLPPLPGQSGKTSQPDEEEEATISD